MSDLGDALAAMSRAHGAFRTLRATVAIRYDERIGAEALARLGEDDRPGDPRPGEPGVRERTYELFLDGDRRNGDPWEELLVDPAGVLAACVFEAAGREVVAGREAILLRARPLEADRYELHGLGYGADAYELAVDAELGAILRSVAFLDGREYERLEVRSVEFDVDLPAREDDGWENDDPFEPELAARSVTIEEAARAVPFGIWFPRGLDEGWDVEVLTDEELVAIRLRRAESSHELAIVQRDAAGLEEGWDWDPEPFETVEHGGEALRVVRSRRHSRILLGRGGTTIELSTQTLPFETLLEVVGALEPVPR